MKLYILAIIMLAGCTKVIDNIYQIKAGHHRGNYPTLPHPGGDGGELTFTFIVNETWLQTAEPCGVNKLCGFSYGPHHDNSARLGWQYVDEQILAYAYTYVEGERFYEPFATLQVGQMYTCSIVREGDNYRFRLNEVEYSCPASGWLPGAVLMPYIGGEGTFENDWYVELW